MAKKSLIATLRGLFSFGSKKHDQELTAFYDELQTRGPLSAVDINREDRTQILVLSILQKLSGVSAGNQAGPYATWVIEQCGCPEEDQCKNASPAYVNATNKARRLLVEHRPRDRAQLEALIS